MRYTASANFMIMSILSHNYIGGFLIIFLTDTRFEESVKSALYNTFLIYGSSGEKCERKYENLLEHISQLIFSFNITLPMS